MAIKQFQAESKRLLDLMINSIYTNKEIFLREIISNASDAIDKRYYKNGESGMSRSDFQIFIDTDEEARTLKICDNGIGMTEEELEKNLGVIAKSGSLDFKTENAELDGTNEMDIIGQFGVGFYSAFMVAKKVKVITKADGSDQAFCWESEGAEGYSITPCEKDEIGTDVILFLKADTEDENYSEYLNEYTLKHLIRFYSDYIRYPIVMDCKKEEPIEASEEEKAKEDYHPEYRTYYEEETINSMVPIWKKNRSEVTDEEYKSFYQDKFNDYAEPSKIIFTNVEGLLSYNALLFIPSQLPYNYYSKDFERGLQLYSSGVLIKEKCEELIPDYFGFVRGVVDSQDLSLNISREMLQHDRQLKAIANRLEKKIISELKDWMLKDRDEYEKFFKTFGLRIKFGIYDNFGANKDKLTDIVMFYSTAAENDKMVTLKEYVDRMKEDQKFIYFATGESIERIKKTPQIELLMDKGYEVLLCTEEVDEFALSALHSFEEKHFKNIAEGDLGIELSDEEKEAAEKKNEDSKEVLDAVKEALGDRVTDVKLSARLKSHPVCISTEGGISLEMERVFREQAKAMGQPEDMIMKASKVLEINGDHPVFEGLKKTFDAGDKDQLKDLALLLYDQALLIEGMAIEDPVAFSNRICALIK